MANRTLALKIPDRYGGHDVINAIKQGTLGYPWDGSRFWWTQRCQVVAGAIGAVALAAATSQEIDLNVAFPSNLFPANVKVDHALVKLTTPGAGPSVSALTAQVGDTNDPNGLLTASSVFAGSGILQTPAAAEHPGLFETAFIPTLLLTATGANLSVLTVLDLTVAIGFQPIVASFVS